MTTTQKDQGWGWVIVVAVMVNIFILDGVRYSYGLLHIEFLLEFKRGKGETSWIGSLMFGVMNIGSIAASVSVNRFGCKKVSIAGAVISTVGYIASIFARNVQHLYITFGILGGFGFSFSKLASIIIVMRWFDRRRSLAYGIAACGSGLGTIVFNPLSKLLIDLYGWRGTLLIEAGIILNGVVCGLVLKPFSNNVCGRAVEESVSFTSANEQHELTNASDSQCMVAPDVALKSDYCKEESLNRIGVRGDIPIVKHRHANLFRSTLLKNPAFLLFSFSFMVQAFPFMIPFTFLPHLVVTDGLSRTQAAWLISIIGIASTVCRPLAGWFGDQNRISRTTLYATTLAASGVFTGLFPFIKTFHLFVVTCVLFGFVLATWTTLLPVVLVDLFGEEAIADSLGVQYFVGFVGSVLGPPMTGWMFDSLGEYKIPFIVAGSEFILSGLLIPFISCLPS